MHRTGPEARYMPFVGTLMDPDFVRHTVDARDGSPSHGEVGHAPGREGRTERWAWVAVLRRWHTPQKSPHG